ncbi:unnamed protein product [Knipowitschia caucasica]
MEANVPPLWCRRVKLQGKVRRRVQDLRIPSSSIFDSLSSRATLELSHNESARLAADCLLSQGLEAYQETLQTEGEVDFLSQLEKKYFLENGEDSEPDAGDGGDAFESSSSSFHSATQCPSVPCSTEDGKAGCQSHESNVELYLYSENRAAGIKDVVREFIRKAETTLALVTDHFSDVELLCDLLEASRKRFVSVHLILDHLNLSIFRDMWHQLRLRSEDFPKLSVCSVKGHTYCAKNGRKLSGQLSETFIISDSTEVLIGSFSFSCLSWVVHRSLAFIVKDSAVPHFLEEFERLSSSSTPVSGFINASTSAPFKTHTDKQQPKSMAISNHTDMVRINKWIEDGLNSHKKENANISSQYSRPLRQPVMQHMCMKKFTKLTLGGIPVQDISKGQKNVLHSHHTQTKSYFSQQVKAQNKSQYGFLYEDYWTQSRATTTPPGIAASITKHRAENDTTKPKSKQTPLLSLSPAFMPLEMRRKQSTKKCVWGPMYGFQTTVMSNGIPAQEQSIRRHSLQSQTSPNTSVATQPKEQKMFTPQQTVLQQVKAPSRLAWMTQNNTMREGATARQKTWHDTTPRILTQMDRRSPITSGKPLTRSKSLTERNEKHIT